MTVFNYFPFKEDEVQINHCLARRRKTGFMLYKTPALEKEECNISSYLKFSQEYNSIIQEFNDSMEENFEESKALFNHNIKTVKIKAPKKNLFQKAMDHFRSSVEQGSYTDYDNQIRIRLPKEEHDSKLKNVVMHELIHMSSKRDNISTGFHQSNIKNSSLRSLGRGINEGYTEKLNQEYFSKYIDQGVYSREIVLASGIERIVGKKKMQELYFNADLRGLLRGINHYVNDMNEVANLIYDIDTLESIRNEAKRENFYQELRNRIADIYSKKLDLEYSLNLINEEEYERKKFFYIEQYVERGIAYSDKVKIIEKSAIYWIEDGHKKDFLKKGKETIKFRPDEVEETLPSVVYQEDAVEDLFDRNSDEKEPMIEERKILEGELLKDSKHQQPYTTKQEVIEMLEDDNPLNSPIKNVAK